MWSFGTHNLLRVIHLTPDELGNIKSSLEEFMSNIKSGDVNRILAGMVRTPTELKMAIESIAGAGAPPAPPPTPATAPLPTTTTRTTERLGISVS